VIWGPPPPVNALMIPQTYLPTKWFITYNTYTSIDIPCHVRVCVGSQYTAVYKQFIIHNTTEWMLSPVNTFILLQLNLLYVRLVKCTAGIDTPHSVCALMFDKHNPHIKWFITDTACVWMFIIMYGSTIFRKILAGRFLTNTTQSWNK
jgi:hypothetical protein